MRAVATELSHTTPDQRIVVGEGAVEVLASHLPSGGRTRVGVVASSRAWASPLGAAVRSALAGSEYDTWHEVPPHTPMHLAHAAARTWADRDIGLLVAVGGGSASDLAKAITMALATGGDLESYFSRRGADGKIVNQRAPVPPVPILALPTTLSGAELTPGAGVTRDGMKHVLWDQHLAARVVLCETSEVNLLPDRVIFTTGMNAVAHCVEATYSSQGNDVSDALARAGLRLLIEGMLRSLVTQRKDARANYALFAGAMLAGQALATARVCLHHALCHVLGARHGVGHGEANAVMLSYVADFNLDASRDAQAALLDDVRQACQRELGVSLVGETLGSALREIQSRIGAPTSLPQIGLTRIDGEALWTALSHERGLSLNPKPVQRDDLFGVLRRAGATLTVAS